MLKHTDCKLDFRRMYITESLETLPGASRLLSSASRRSQYVFKLSSTCKTHSKGVVEAEQFCRLQDASKRLQDSSRQLKDAWGRLKYVINRFQVASRQPKGAWRRFEYIFRPIQNPFKRCCWKHTDWKTSVFKWCMIPNRCLQAPRCIQYASRRFQDASRQVKDASIPINTCWNATKTPSNGIVKASRVKAWFWNDVWCHSSVFARSKMYSRLFQAPSRRFKTA